MPALVMLKIQKKFHLRVAEWLMAAIMISWGTELTLVPTMFASNPFFYELQRFAPQALWATILLMVGTVRFAALIINGAWRASPHVRMVMAFVSCFVWLEISCGLAHLGHPTLGVVVYPWLLIADIYAVFRASGDARLSDEQAKVSITL